jgi:hypothetical protein
LENESGFVKKDFEKISAFQYYSLRGMYPKPFIFYAGITLTNKKIRPKKTELLFGLL